MDLELVSSRGKVILNNQRLLIQNLKTDIRQTAIGEITAPLIILGGAFFSFWAPSKAFGYLGTIIFLALFFSSYFKQLYVVLFKKSYSDYIPLNRIVSFELKPDEFGLETELRLYLKNGRYRSIMFRTLEKQYEPFVEQLSQYLAAPQFA